MQHSEAERVKLAAILRYVFRSKVAVGLLVLLFALILAELAWSEFRESFSEKYPFTVGVISSFLFIALGTIAVDLYLRERDEQRRLLELARERESWSTAARRIFDELQDALGRPSGTATEALLSLMEAEAGRRDRDLEEIARPVEEAAKPVKAVLNQHLDLMLKRPELAEAARQAEEAIEAIEVAAGTVRHWNFDKPDYTGLRVTVESLVEGEQWFFERSLANADEVIERVTRSLET